jgi:hypothetical protein
MLLLHVKYLAKIVNLVLNVDVPCSLVLSLFSLCLSVCASLNELMSAHLHNSGYSGTVTVIFVLVVSSNPTICTFVQ